MANVVAGGEVKYEENLIVNSRGVKQFVCSWAPLTREPVALIFLCHGYGMECSVYMAETGVRLAGAGYGVFGIDAEGHGKSDGMRAFVKSFDDLVDNTRAYFQTIREQENYKLKPKFLFGESMGGAVALHIHLKEPNVWNGAVLLAPMCKISEKLKPPAIVTAVLSKLAFVIPTWKIVPSADIIDHAFKDPIKRLQVRQNAYVYQDKPRLRTALEMLDASTYLEKNLSLVTIPFLVLHGEADTVTDPEVSKALYEQAKSTDKTMKIYPGMWHCIHSGEPDENCELVYNDIFTWLAQRAKGGPVGTANL